jgi:hypothetical protein
MNRRNFLKITGAVSFGAGALNNVFGFIPAHNWEKYDFGSGPIVKDRLNQGPFPIYEPEVVAPGSEVVMVTSPSNKILKNFGMGLTVYISGDLGPPRLKGETLEKSIEDLVKLPFVQKLYIRPNWKEMQTVYGKLNLPDYWEITFDLAKQYNKRIGFRVMTENPDGPEIGVPDFLLDKVPYQTIKGSWRNKDNYRLPRYDHPEYQKAFTSFNELLAAELNGSPQIEYMDTFMYGFWGEGHTWPLEGNPFPDNVAAEKTFMQMFDTQLKYWTKTPLVTNTQPDFSQVGNSEIVDKTIRTHNWLRTDTIYIENEQIESLSNRVPWAAAILEVPIETVDEYEKSMHEGIGNNDLVISHVMDVGANYWSIWNWHNIAAKNVLGYYEKYPDAIDNMARKIGYRVRPSWIWSFNKDGHPGLIMGFVNDGIASVPGILRITVFNEGGLVHVSGCLDPGYPKTSGVRQAMFILPEGTEWKGLRVKAELEVKGELYPVEWACHQKLNEDGSLTLSPNL